MHTEEQAKTLWCPLARPAEGPNTSLHVDETHWNTCSGSQCAMWRWADPTTRYATPSARKGFCGLAGKPLM